MLLDANDADRGVFAADFDACVIGTGPAGMTVARRLAAKGLIVALMEGGGIDLESESQALYAGEVVGLDYYPLEDARLRMFGGSSMHWGGRCRELDAEQLPAAPFETLRGWPIAKADLDPYQAETDTILDLIPAADAPESAGRPGRGALPPHPVPLQPADPLRREVPGRDRRQPGDHLRHQRQPRRPPPRRRARDGDRARSSSPSPPTTRASPSRRGSSCSASAASRTRGRCSTAPARSRSASATRTTSSAAISASIRTTASARSTTRTRSPRRRCSATPEEAYAPTRPSWRSTRS